MAISGSKKSKSVEGSVSHVIEMNCLETAQVNDWVRLSDIDNNTVLSATDNLVKRPVIGILSEKITPTRAKIMLRGVYSINITDIGRFWLSSSGSAEINRPVSGYLQSIGFSFGNGQILIDPDYTLTKIN